MWGINVVGYESNMEKLYLNSGMFSTPGNCYLFVPLKNCRFSKLSSDPKYPCPSDTYVLCSF